MTAPFRLALSAASLTPQEVALCYQNEISFTDLTILVVGSGETVGRSMWNVHLAFARGAFIVWQLDPVCEVVTVFPSWTHLKVFRADDELVMEELPLFRCRVSEFFRLLGVPPEAA
jgi:hypothetical protein